MSYKNSVSFMFIACIRLTIGYKARFVEDGIRIREIIEEKRGQLICYGVQQVNCPFFLMFFLYDSVGFHNGDVSFLKNKRGGGNKLKVSSDYKKNLDGSVFGGLGDGFADGLVAGAEVNLADVANVGKLLFGLDFKGVMLHKAGAYDTGGNGYKTYA